jgi:4'-phosphopantetheinyl transferase
VRGRPELADSGARIDFNVSHTRGVALMAIARDVPSTTRIGVDIEHTEREAGVDRLQKKFLAPGERALIAGLSPDERRRHFLHYWTCKEAMSKATGDGIIAPFGRLEVELGDPPRLRAGPPPYVPADWSLIDAAVPAEWFATVAIWRRAH